MIRRAAIADIPAIAALSSQLGSPVDPETMPGRLARILDLATHAVFVAEGDAGPCGFAAAEHRLLPSGEWVELGSLVVDAQVRRGGMGTQLVAAVEAWARRRGVDRVRVRASLAREAAHDFYPALGYERTKTQHVYTRTVR
ncbi:GNAT family N-acetyltransferase [Luteimonas viscosa]|uniref:GNAT family N-acetyltransferase n=1 Tax=Luteimonas viscosa TaxID=1132694 RepID=A0A5D4XQH8_9GAMM|nr:GNAT family N-acetyltransferase [Luteimonas viscosa]TYT26809.1 GNAT family N-acetyltransferase [Luteimonas viscosa]